MEISYTMPQKSNTRDFYADGVSTALGNCEKAGYEALFMPELIERRIAARGSYKIWRNWYAARSVKETGKTPAGSKVVLFSHVPSYLSEAKNIETAVKA